MMKQWLMRAKSIRPGTVGLEDWKHLGAVTCGGSGENENRALTENVQVKETLSP